MKSIPLIALLLATCLVRAEEPLLSPEEVPEIKTAREFFTLSETEGLKRIGGRIEVHGLLRTTSAIVSRAFLGRMICVDSVDKVRLLDSVSDPFSAPELNLRRYNLPSELAHTGNRRTKGRVLAVWGAGPGRARHLPLEPHPLVQGLPPRARPFGGNPRPRRGRGHRPAQAPAQDLT